MAFFEDDNQVAYNTFKQVVNAIQRKDETVLKNLFSKRVRNEVSDFDESVVDLLDFFQGEVISFDDRAGVGVDETIEYGKKRKEIQSSNSVKTSEQKYYIAIKECTKDTFDSDNVGVISVYIINAENWNVTVTYRGDGKWTLGIVIDQKKE